MSDNRRRADMGYVCEVCNKASEDVERWLVTRPTDGDPGELIIKCDRCVEVGDLLLSERAGDVLRWVYEAAVHSDTPDTVLYEEAWTLDGRVMVSRTVQVAGGGGALSGVEPVRRGLPVEELARRYHYRCCGPAWWGPELEQARVELLLARQEEDA